MRDEPAFLCSCTTLGEATALRASLQARGLWVFIEGEHQGGVPAMGWAPELRVMVRASQLARARELAREIMVGLPGASTSELEAELEAAADIELTEELAPRSGAVPAGSLIWLALVGAAMLVGLGTLLF
ncbi:hypothetical protein PPSIR1_33454 [Plesiocystis pacifica SIR-1]|uniref:DUF2007 domain-containing protein n=1 Tax=Plesiocystis pacifica SIR-1 TaxID=391625 RepID=A6G6P7_9BACT|nr:DUF2007 domain-containing protein [Plesiocystis pacifica]EDM78524.1 hypothetical protein PPSIR1_33454 [Plesiocystis pacifica SIR-1]